MASFRLAPASTYNSRTGATTADVTAGIFGVGVFGVAIFGKTATASAKDGGMVNAFIQTVMQIDKKALYCVKRPGWELHSTPAADEIGHALLVWTGNGAGDKVISAFANPSVIYDGTTSLGEISGTCTSLTETVVGATVQTIVMSGSDNSGWSMASDADSATFTGKTVDGHARVGSLSSAVGHYAGQAVTGSGIPGGTRILTVDGLVTETASVAFIGGILNQTVNVAGLIFTLSGTHSATVVGDAFASLTAGATTGPGIANGAYTGILVAFNSGTNAAGTVIFTSTTANSDVTNITVAGTIAPTATTFNGGQQITLNANATITAAGVTITPEKLSKIIDVDFPGNAGLKLAGGFVHMDGFAAIMTTDGRLWASQLNTLTGWVATSFGSADTYPDRGVGAIRHKNMIICFGTESIQFFYNAGLATFPFAKSMAMTVKIGAVSADAITSIADTIFFAGSTPQGGLSIFQWDGGLTRVSTPELDAILILNGSSGITLTSLRFYGRSFILVSTGNYTLAYCLEEKLWHEWVGLNNLWYKCAGASVGAPLLNYCISNTVHGGKVYKMDTAAFVYTDDGAAILSKINLPNEDMGTARKKFIHEIELIADIEASSSPVGIAYSDDDYKTFTSLGIVDLSDARRRLTRCGSTRKRAWQLTHAADTKFRIEAIEGRYEVGIS